MAPRLPGMALLLVALAPAACAQPSPPPLESRIPPGPFLLFYDYGGDELGERNRLILANLLEIRRAGHANYLFVEGYSDTADTAEQSVAVSRRRAWTVHDYLVEAGVPSAAITVRYYGEECPLVTTEDGVREPQNRRVQIWFSVSRETLGRSGRLCRAAFGCRQPARPLRHLRHDRGR